MNENKRNLQEELIEEGIRLIVENGVEGFSMRCVAEHCQVSCAAPFKHFKDKQDFFIRISEKMDQDLMEEMRILEERISGDHEQAHLAMSQAYVKYLIQYPFLINQSFWRIINKDQAIGIRSWKSFQWMIYHFMKDMAEREIEREKQQEYYFAFQTIAYGSAFVTVSGLLMEEDRLEEYLTRVYGWIGQMMEKETRTGKKKGGRKDDFDKKDCT